MSKSLRLSEKWFRRGLWLGGLVFAGFLIGLGGTIVGDLPKVEAPLRVDDFLDGRRPRPCAARCRPPAQAEQEAQTALEQAQLQRSKTRSESQAARETFNNWLATRSATQRAEHDPEVLARTQALDALKQAERTAQQAVEAQQQAALDARQAAAAAQARLSTLEAEATKSCNAERRKVELRVFLYRLALTLPLLVVAGWLFAKKRKSTYWPFVWGFIFFRAVCLLRRTGALPAQLRRLRALCGGHRHHGAGGALCHPGAQPLPGAAEAGRVLARPAAPQRAELRRGPGAPGQKRVPRLRAPGGPEERQDRLLPALRHRPV
jgi:hypothetical protein